MNLSVEFKNFKKIKDFQGDFISGNVYVVGGKNDQGKTTFLQGIAAIATGNPAKNNCVSFGEDKGQVKGQFDFSAANGGVYTVKWDFTAETNKFVLIDPDTNILKSTPRANVIGDIFKYNAFTIDEWFGWGLTAEGRKKQAEIILNLLPEDARLEYDSIEAEISPKGGVLFLQRASASKEYDAAKIVVDTFKPTVAEIESLKTLAAAKKQLGEIEVELETALASDLPVLKLKQENAITAVDNCQKDIDNTLRDIDEITDEMEKLRKLLTEKQSHKKTLDAELIILKEAVTNINSEIKNIPPVTDSEALRERIKKGKEYIKSIEDIENKNTNYENAKKTAVLKFDEYDSLDADIKVKRERKAAIIEENKLPVENITIEDGECFYIDGENYIPFVKDSVSYSAGGMIILKLMAFLNKNLPIWLIGSAESYDNDRLPIICDIAKQYNGIIFMDRVIPESEDGITINALEL